MASLYIVHGPDQGIVRTLKDDSYLTIGRSDEAQLQLVDERASRVHCRLRPVKELNEDFGIEVTRWMLEDAGSSNGTRIGAEVITEAARLNDGMIIGLGQTSVVFLEKTVKTAADAKARCEALGLDANTLAEQAWPLNNPESTGTLNEDG